MNLATAAQAFATQQVVTATEQGAVSLRVVGVIVSLRGDWVIIRPLKLGVYQGPDHSTSIANLSA